MLVSHEVPISLLKYSQNFNDYDYCLLHLTYEYPEYKEYYINAIKKGRKVLLDNSLFELGDALSNEELAQGVKDLNPTWYIIPDCLNDADETIKRFDSFIKDYLTLSGQKIGVAQGKNLKDLIKCYKYMSKHADKIAIPFDSKAFEQLYPCEDKLLSWCIGRQVFISLLYNLGIWNNNKPHHLLGCSYAREFSNKLYRELNIETIDTSNPIVAGIKDLEYSSKGLFIKPSIKLCDLIDAKLTKKQKNLIKKNVKIFKNICEGK